MRKYFFILIALLVMILSACSPATPVATTAPTQVPTQVPTQPIEVTIAPTELVVEPTSLPLDPVTLKVGILPYTAYTPQIIAQEAGFYEEQGITVEFVTFKSSNEAVIALAAGQIDVTSGFLDVASLNAIAQGTNLKYVADEGFVDPDATCAYSTWVVKKSDLDSGRFDDLANLSGMNLGFRQGGLIEYALTILLNQANLTISDVNITNIPPQNVNESLLNGAIDIAHDGEPWVTRALANDELALWQTWNSYMPNQQFGAMYFGPTIMDGQQDVGKRFMVAYLKGIQQYNQGKTESNIAAMANLTKMDPVEVEKTCWQAFRNDGSIDIESILAFQQWAVDSGYMDTVLTESDIWDSQFIDYANQFLP